MKAERIYVFGTEKELKNLEHKQDVMHVPEVETGCYACLPVTGIGTIFKPAPVTGRPGRLRKIGRPPGLYFYFS